MSIKTLLKKLFAHYAEMGARSPSYRGCCERPVPKEMTSLQTKEKSK